MHICISFFYSCLQVKNTYIWIVKAFYFDNHEKRHDIWNPSEERWRQIVRRKDKLKDSSTFSFSSPMLSPSCTGEAAALEPLKDAVILFLGEPSIERERRLESGTRGMVLSRAVLWKPQRRSFVLIFMVKGVKFEWSRNDESSREEKLARNKTEWKMTGGSQGKRK